MGDFLKQLGLGVLSFLIAIFLFSLVFDSQVRNQTMSVFDMATDEIGDVAKDVLPVEKEPASSLYDACLEDINQRIGILKQKAAKATSIRILESKHFTVLEDYEEYRDMWGWEDVGANKMLRPDLYDQSDAERTLVVLKVEHSVEGTDVAITTPLLCIDGKPTEHTELRLQVPMSLF